MLALLAAGCTADGELRAGDAATVAPGSTAEVSLADGEWEVLGAGEAVPEGARVRVRDTAGTRLLFRDGAVRLNPNAAATVTGERLSLERGEALISSTGDFGASLEDTTLAGQGLYRISSGLSGRVGVYRGSVTVRRPAQERTVTALRELDMSDFRLDARAAPLRYREGDAWDQELLADAIAFDGEAARLTRGLDRELGTSPLRPFAYRPFARGGLLDALASTAAVTRKGAFGPPSDVLLTMFVARAAAADRVVPTVRKVAALRDLGARWGLIALELQVTSERVIAAIDRLDNEQLALADASPAQRSAAGPGAGAARTDSTTGSGQPASAAVTASAPAATSGTGGTTSTGTTTTGTTDGGGTGTTSPGGGTTAPPPDDGDAVGPVVDEVNKRIAPPDEEAGGGGPLPEELGSVGDLIDPNR